VQLPQGRQARAANHAATDSDIRGIHTARLEHSKKSNPQVRHARHPAQNDAVQGGDAGLKHSCKLENLPKGDGSMTRPLLSLCCGLALFAGETIAFAADRSDTEMAERYSRAALAGDDRAQFYLGALYSAGVGLTQSDAEAFNWISRAAQQGHSQAMLVLGGLLAIGRGASKDEVAAYKWAYIVAEGSRVYDLKNGARQLLTLLETRMNPADIAQAKSDAERFRASKSSSAPNSANDVGSNPVPQPPSQQQPQSQPQTQSQPQPPTASAAQPAPMSSSPGSKPAAERVAPVSKAGRSSDIDIDRLLDNVPSNIRKRYGF
jgi:hypothetical protein